jgi:hypothetical protein
MIKREILWIIREAFYFRIKMEMQKLNCKENISGITAITIRYCSMKRE